jgi:hypothetical protein
MNDFAGSLPRRCCCAGACSTVSRLSPKSTQRERIFENAQIFDFALSDDDMGELNALDQTNGTGRAGERKWWVSFAKKAVARPLNI